MQINQKFVEIIFNLIQEQNKQLLKIVAEEQGMDYATLVKNYVPSRASFHYYMRTKGLQPLQE